MLATAGVAPNQSRSATLITVADFDFSTGAAPSAGLCTDSYGNLFGTTSAGGAYGKGTVFEIAKLPGGYASSPTILVSFKGDDGASPKAGVIADPEGNLFGTTSAGGASGQGTVFEIAKTPRGYASTPTTLISFNVRDGATPLAGLTADARGDLLGTTSAGGAHADGTVYEIARAAVGHAGSLQTLVSFEFANGSAPLGGLITDGRGNLFGTTSLGGVHGQGTVFEIAKTARGYATSPTTLVSFDFSNGATPSAGLMMGANGDLFGTTSAGGASGQGTVFEITKSAGGYAESPTVLISFKGDDGASPQAGVIADADGNLFGTTSAGGASGYGTVFEIAKTSHGYANSPTTLISFNLIHGGAPSASLIADAKGNLFGTTAIGGAHRYYGTTFELVDSGFVPENVVPRTPGKVMAPHPQGRHASVWLCQPCNVAFRSAVAGP